MNSSSTQKFRAGHEPAGKVVNFKDVNHEDQPTVLHFPPTAYKMVRDEALEEWKREVAERLNVDFDLEDGSGATATFSERGRGDAAPLCDSDITTLSDFVETPEATQGLHPWDGQPVVLNFKPEAYEILEPPHLPDWIDDMRKHFGLRFDPHLTTGGTITFCRKPYGPSGTEVYACDCDM